EHPALDGAQVADEVAAGEGPWLIGPLQALGRDAEDDAARPLPHALEVSKVEKREDRLDALNLHGSPSVPPVPQDAFLAPFVYGARVKSRKGGACEKVCGEDPRRVPLRPDPGGGRGTGQGPVAGLAPSLRRLPGRAVLPDHQPAGAQPGVAPGPPESGAHRDGVAVR